MTKEKTVNHSRDTTENGDLGQRIRRHVIEENGLQILLDKILVYEPSWSVLYESCLELTEFAIDHRYPGTTTSEQESENAVIYASIIRKTVRKSFGLDS